MTTKFTGLRALGKAMRLKSPIDTQIPIEMQMALLRLAVRDKAEPHSRTPRLLAEQEMTEQPVKMETSPKKRVSLVERLAEIHPPSPPPQPELPVPHRTSA